MALKEQVSKGWADHGDDPAGVSARFDELLALVADASELPQVAGLFVHVDGEHLGEWAQAQGRVDELLAHEVLEDGPERGSLLRSKAAMALCAGDPGLADAYEGANRVRVLAVAASAAVGQERIEDGGRWFSEAIGLAGELPTDDPAIRSVAITANNLAAGLEQTSDRSAEQDQLMLESAQQARRFWELAGTWVNVERAEYRLAMSHLQAGQPAQALTHADNCLQICTENVAEAGELFFAHEARSRALHAGAGEGAREARDQAAEALAAIENEGFRSWCATELAKLDASLG